MFPFGSRPSGWCRRWAWARAASRCASVLEGWAKFQVAPVSRFPVPSEVPAWRLIVVIACEEIAAGLRNSAVSSERSSRYGVWREYDRWLSWFSPGPSLEALARVPYQHERAVLALAAERQARAKMWSWAVMYASALLALVLLLSTSVPLLVSGVVAAAGYVVSTARRVWVHVGARRLRSGVSAARAAAESGPVAQYESLVLGVFGPAASWPVGAVWRMRRGVEEYPQFVGAWQWASSQVEDFLAARGASSDEREVFEVLGHDGFDGSLEELLDVARLV